MHVNVFSRECVIIFTEHALRRFVADGGHFIDVFVSVHSDQGIDVPKALWIINLCYSGH